MIGGLQGQMPEADFRFRRSRIINDLLDIARLLSG